MGIIGVFEKGSFSERQENRKLLLGTCTFRSRLLEFLCSERDYSSFDKVADVLKLSICSTDIDVLRHLLVFTTTSKCLGIYL